MGKHAYPDESGLPKSTKNKILLWVVSILILAILLAIMGYRTEEIMAGVFIWAALTGVVTLFAIIVDTLTNRRNRSK